MRRTTRKLVAVVAGVMFTGAVAACESSRPTQVEPVEVRGGASFSDYSIGQPRNDTTTAGSTTESDSTTTSRCSDYAIGQPHCS